MEEVEKLDWEQEDVRGANFIRLTGPDNVKRIAMHPNLLSEYERHQRRQRLRCGFRSRLQCYYKSSRHTLHGRNEPRLGLQRYSARLRQTPTGVLEN
jgi:hypothetical protein